MTGPDQIPELPPQGRDQMPRTSALRDGRIHLCDGMIVSVNRSWQVGAATLDRPVAVFKAMARVAFWSADGPDGGDVYLAAVTAQDAYWLGFETEVGSSYGVITTIDDTNVLTGRSGSADRMSPNPMNFLLVPDQPWFDAILGRDGKFHQLIPEFRRSSAAGIGAVIGVTAFVLADNALSEPLDRNTDEVKPLYALGQADPDKAGKAHLWRSRALVENFKSPPACAAITVYLVTPNAFRDLTGKQLEPEQFIEKGAAPAPFDPFE